MCKLLKGEEAGTREKVSRGGRGRGRNDLLRQEEA